MRMVGRSFGLMGFASGALVTLVLGGATACGGGDFSGAPASGGAGGLDASVADVDQDGSGGNSGTGGVAGTGGDAGSGGIAGSGGAAGTAGTGGTAGSAGTGGTGGASTDAGDDASDASDAPDASDASDASDAPLCAAQFKYCGGNCVSSNAPENGCASANCDACPIPSAGQAICTNGACAVQCEGILTQCGSACVELKSAPNHCGRCNHSCNPEGGTKSECNAGVCRAITLATVAGLNEIALDQKNIYFSIKTSIGSIQKVPKAGGALKVLASNENTPDGLTAVDSDFVYFVSQTDGGSVRRISKDAEAATAEWIVSGLTQPSDITRVGTELWWTNWNPGEVYRQTASTSPVFTGYNPHRITSFGGQIAWTVWNGPAGGGSVQLWDGTKVVPLALNEYQPVGVAMDSTAVYWTTQGGGSVTPTVHAEIRKVLIAKPKQVMVIATSIINSVGITIDAGYVYYTDMGVVNVNRGVYRVPISSTDASITPELVANDVPGSYYVAVDDKWVYWTNNLTGTIQRVAK